MQVIRWPRVDRLTRRTQLVTAPAQVAAWDLNELSVARLFSSTTDDGTPM